MHLPLNALRAFEASARHLNLTRAAEELHVTQTAVSQHIRKLEDRLGKPLFRRLPRGLALTDEGQALLPVVVAPKTPLAFRAWTPQTPMVKDRYGIETPAEGEFVVPQALLIPVNAFDVAGYRIGYGGGFFDRTLATTVPMPLSIGVGFELARLDSIHPEAHDQRLDAMVSEAGVFHFG